ncbi:MAG: transglycosylase domain-containing protein, partial [Actinomycetota bacterium]|nr:transglycosylase domain-containing protein [Actinomycetota bacterium]
MRRVPVALLCCLLLAGCSRLVRLEARPLPTAAVAAPEQSLVYAADGSVIATLRFANRVNVERNDIPPVVIDAVLAAEDRRFYEHAGVDLRAVARAAVANRRAGRVVQGGSTLTQQLVKNRYFPDAAETLERKSAEARLALALERDATKDEILTDYLNTVYFGDGAYGIQAAARHYVGTDAADLTLPQAALLAGLIRSPERTDPREHPAAAAAARQRVLDAMVATGAVGVDEA